MLFTSRMLQCVIAEHDDTLQAGICKMDAMLQHKLHVFLPLGTLSSDAPGQLNVLWHDGHTLGMNCTQVGVCTTIHVFL